MEQRLKNPTCKKCKNYTSNCAFNNEIIWRFALDHVIACAGFEWKKGNFFGLDLDQCDSFVRIHKE